ncbi:DNA-directed DNA/RNA polymerase mu isoform X3 [Misgurnus anguillicaudatus]|uniref:DNA-directed DNA/RNA polymerase mu isoform X3 n=1 Tax=Misgurnus anguillicaudatus TaxID=75329 RepID=UPI003CCF9A09
MIPLKRRKVSQTVNQPNQTCKFPHVSIFILERKMGSTRRAFLTRLGRSKGFLITDTYSSSITHVVSENNTGDDVQTWIDNQTGQESSSSVHLLGIIWFTESMEAGQPVPVEDRHILKEALELLAENAEYSDNEGRSVAFRRAASVLKALPYRVQTMDQLKCLPCLGEHSQRVIKEILEDGTSSEVESTRHSEQFQAMKALTGIFGVGVKTADRWFREGLRSPSDLICTGQQLNRAQQAGLQFYDDLNKHVTKAEADMISEIVKEAVSAVLPGAEIQLMGGFRRGKEVGHDVDFLITHPEEGREEGLMPKIINWLEGRNLLLYQKWTRNSYLEKLDGPARPANNMDRFERCFSIFKLDRPAEATGSEGVRSSDQSEASSWRAVRVDLVVSPYSQFAFATLGWTGSKLFERELRRWAGQEKRMSLSSHALYDSNQRCYVRVQSEEEIFAYLGLEFIPPCERNA